MKIAFVHYNIGTKDGVNTVIRTNALAILEKYRNSQVFFVGHIVRPLIKGYGKRVKHINISELDIIKEGKQAGFTDTTVFDYIEKGITIYPELTDVLKDMDYIIIENPNLGAHPAITYAYYRFVKMNYNQKAKRKIIYRIHDFAEDRPKNFLNILKFTGTNNTPYWHKMMFPRIGNLSFAAINRKDLNRLHVNGVLEENRAFHIPNSINTKLLVEDVESSQELKKRILTANNMPADTKLLYYPVRIVSRKNIEEAIFLTHYINKKTKGKYALLITLKPSSSAKDSYYNTLKKFVAKHKLPAILGVDENITMNRITDKEGNIKTFGIGDVYNICDKVLSSSPMEGFGLFFIESWFFKKALIGRDIPGITVDFKDKGMNFDHLYSGLFIDGKDFKDYPDMKERLKLIIKLNHKKFLKAFEEENSYALGKLNEVFEEDKARNLINTNRKVVLKEFSYDTISKTIMRYLKKAPTKMVLKKKHKIFN